VTLALWRVRRTWRLLLLAGIGILAAVTLVCTVPLYSEVSMTAGLRGVLTATPQSAELTVQATSQVLAPTILDQETQSLNQIIQQQLKPYLQTSTEFFLETPSFKIDAPASNKCKIDAPDSKCYSMLLYGAPMQEAARHIHLLRGRLPAQRSHALEIALTQQAADYLKLDVGSMMKVGLYYQSLNGGEVFDEPLQVVGIIVSNPTDPFWHGEDFDTRPGPRGEPPSNYTALMSNDAFVAELQQLASALQLYNGWYFFALNENPTLYWYYHLNSSSIGIGQVDDLIRRLQVAQEQIGSGQLRLPRILSGALIHTQLSGPPLGARQGTSTLEHFRSRTSLVAIPVTLALLQVVGLLLFFVGLMTSLLVERQAEVIAVLRSRGASRRHIFGSFVTQGIGLALLALLAGPLLAILATRLLVHMTLATADQQAQQVISGAPLPVALKVGWLALVTALCAVGVMILALWGATRRDVLEMRREAARVTRQPFWQRIYLDVIAAIIALTGFLLLLYISNSGALSTQMSLTIATPLALVAPIFLGIAGMLFFLRGFPWLLRRLAGLTSRRPGVTPMLALAQMARAPHQAVRMILLLALASSFAGFALVFLASETQHLQAIAAYETGADFSGALQAPVPADALTQQAAAYRAIPGVTSATLGFAEDGLVPSTSTIVSVRAVEASTFAQTAIWTAQDSRQSLASLMDQLLARRLPAKAGQSIPAIVDALTWQKLNLSAGASFTLQIDAQTLSFTALAEVDHIPTVQDSLAPGRASDFTPPGGMLIDYQSLVSVMFASHGVLLPVNYIWLRTSDDPALVAKTRAALAHGPLALATVNDRRAILSALEHDPLYLALMEVLTVGTAMTILLALLGNWMAAWQSARTRLSNFAVLRALGTTPRQLASLLTWEQVMVYTTALALGAFFGALLAVTIVPALVFTGISSYTADISSGEFSMLQHILPIQVVVPDLLVIAFAALIIMGAVAIGMMARVASKAAIGQTLRLNAD
jgi:hypothetical protein